MIGATEIWSIILLSLLIGLPLRYLRLTRLEVRELRREVEELRDRLGGARGA